MVDTIKDPQDFEKDISDTVITEIRARFKPPIIAAIGAKEPERDHYSHEIGHHVGYNLRSLLENGKGGHIATGGSKGVGVHIYQGVLAWCRSPEAEKVYNTQHTKDADHIPDKFFALQSQGADPHQDYEVALHAATVDPDQRGAKRTLRVINAGKDGQLRRWYLGAVADLTVVVNGEEGTLEEALVSLYKKKPVVTIYQSGRVATLLADLKSSGAKNYDERAAVVRSYGFDPEDKNFRFLLGNGRVDLSNIHIVRGNKREQLRRNLQKFVERLK